MLNFEYNVLTNLNEDMQNDFVEDKENNELHDFHVRLKARKLNSKPEIISR